MLKRIIILIILFVFINKINAQQKIESDYSYYFQDTQVWIRHFNKLNSSWGEWEYKNDSTTYIVILLKEKLIKLTTPTAVNKFYFDRIKIPANTKEELTIIFLFDKNIKQIATLKFNSPNLKADFISFRIKDATTEMLFYLNKYYSE